MHLIRCINTTQNIIWFPSCHWTPARLFVTVEKPQIFAQYSGVHEREELFARYMYVALVCSKRKIDRRCLTWLVVSLLPAPKFVIAYQRCRHKDSRPPPPSPLLSNIAWQLTHYYSSVWKPFNFMSWRSQFFLYYLRFWTIIQAE